MCQLFKVLSIFCMLMILKSNAARILCMFPTPSFSHQVVYRVLTQELARRGHEVVVITPHPAFRAGESPVNLTEIDVQETQELWYDEISKFYNIMSNDVNIFKMYYALFTKIFEKQIQSKSVQELLKNKRDHFDLLIIESNVRGTIGLTHIFDAPVIQSSTFGPMVGTYSFFGAAAHSIIHPSSLNLRSYNLTIWETLNNLYRTALIEYSFYSYDHEEDKMLQRNFGSDIPPVSELIERVNMYLQSTYPIWASNPPVPLNIVYLGGLHQKPANDLPKELKTFLDSSKNGTIYVSFGSNVNPSQLSTEKLEMMARVFSSLPYEVLWKSDKHVEIKNAKNIKIATWLPQADLLYHPKIKLFITQGGLQSTEEAIGAAVPMIGIPIFGDQWFNVEKYVHLKIGLQLDWLTLTEEQFKKFIETVMQQQSFKDNIVRLRSILADQPVSPLDRAIWWIEYVIRHGGTHHLRPLSADMPWTQYYELELIGIVISVILCVLGTCSFLIIKTVRWLCSRTYKRHVKMY